MGFFPREMTFGSSLSASRCFGSVLLVSQEHCWVLDLKKTTKTQAWTLHKPVWLPEEWRFCSQTSRWQNSCTLVCSHFGLSRAPLLHHLGWSSSPTSLSQHHNRALTAENLISITSARFWCLNSSCQQTKEKMIFFFSADQRFSRRGWSQMCYSVVLKRPDKDTWGELYLLLFWLNYPIKLIQRSQQAQNTITHTPIKAEEQFPPPQI